MENKQFNKSYKFAELLDGDVFYFAGDKDKTVYEYAFRRGDRDPTIRARHEQQFNIAKLNQRKRDIIFLRKTGTS